MAGKTETPSKPKTDTIHIDRQQFKVSGDTITGAELRRLPSSDIAADLDLWLEVPGGEDNRIDAEEVVALKSGLHFFTAPRTINPGRAR